MQASISGRLKARRASRHSSCRPGRGAVAAHRLPSRRIYNMLLGGGGAETLQDRGSLSSSARHTLHPYYSNSAPARWQEYVRWYMTSWEARKIIDIPVDDALRRPVELRGLEPADRAALEDAMQKYALDAKIRRALIQERLLGGAVIFPVLLRPNSESFAEPLDESSILPGDLLSFSVIDVSRISSPEYDADPFSPDFDSVQTLVVNGVRVHRSRLCLLDGDALFARSSQNTMQGWRLNPCGFGESKLAPLYDLLNRVIGTQQGAYHLVNMASCLLVEVDNLRSVLAAESPAAAKLQEIVEQISLYRGAVIDARGARVSQHSASFGSVPELVMTFAQLLSAASDIPATRFLGQAPGGLNATGEADQANYYDMVASFQRLSLMPLQRNCLDRIGLNLWGAKGWKEKSRNLELYYPPLKIMSEKEESEIAKTYADLVQGLSGAGMISPESAMGELIERKIFRSPVEAMQPPQPAQDEQKGKAKKEAQGTEEGGEESTPKTEAGPHSGLHEGQGENERVSQ